MGGPACVKTILCGNGGDAAVAIFVDQHQGPDIFVAAARLRAEIANAIEVVKVLIAEDYTVSFEQADKIIDTMNEIEGELTAMGRHQGIGAMTGWTATLHAAVPQLYKDVTGQDTTYPGDGS